MAHVPTSTNTSFFLENFCSQIERIRSEINSSFSEMMKVLEERRNLLLRQLDNLSQDHNIFPKSFQSGKKNNLLSHLGFNESFTPEELYELKFNLDPNLTRCLHNIGLIQVTITKNLNLQMDNIITSQRNNYTPCKVRWSGDKLFVLDNGNNCIDVLTREGELTASFPLQVEIAKDDLICFAASTDYLLLARQSSNIVTYYKHDGTLLPGLPYYLENPVNMTARGEMVAIVDKGSHNVLLFPQYSDRVTVIGSDCSRPGQLYKPADAAFTPDSCLLVLDHKNPCLHLYDLKGHYLTSFGSTLVRFDISHPACFSIDQYGVVLLVHKRSKKLTIFNPTRSIAYKLGVQSRIHGYLFPTSCAVQGDLLAVSYGDNNITGICDTAVFKQGFIHNLGSF